MSPSNGGDGGSLLILRVSRSPWRVPASWEHGIRSICWLILAFVYERVPHITLKSIANNAEIDVIWHQWKEKLEFDLTIPERDMTPANFRSITQIAQLVGTLS
jgi:hypothetical protein